MEVFLTLLEKTAEYINNQEDLSDIKSGEAFESYVVDVMGTIANNMGILSKEDIEQTGKNAFPDIVVQGFYGVEVKYSNSGKWESLGNSIFEGTSVGELEEVYLLFGRRVNEKIEVRYKRYEDSLVDVKVTHSPRFIVSMAENSDSIFENLHIQYNEFKMMDKVNKGKEIKAYFRKNLKKGQEVWFLDPEDSQTSVTINPFSGLDKAEQHRLLIEAYILFPEVFSTSTTKYAGVSSYWITRYQVYNSALRDKFSASGKEIIDYPGVGQIIVKKIYKNLYTLSKKVKVYIENADNDFIDKVIEKWKLSPGELDKSNLLIKWLERIDEEGAVPSDDHKEILPSDIFNAGLQKL